MPPRCLCRGPATCVQPAVHLNLATLVTPSPPCRECRGAASVRRVACTADITDVSSQGYQMSIPAGEAGSLGFGAMQMICRVRRHHNRLGACPSRRHTTVARRSRGSCHEAQHSRAVMRCPGVSPRSIKAITSSLLQGSCSSHLAALPKSGTPALRSPHCIGDQVPSIGFLLIVQRAPEGRHERCAYPTVFVNVQRPS